MEKADKLRRSLLERIKEMREWIAVRMGRKSSRQGRVYMRVMGTEGKCGQRFP